MFDGQVEFVVQEMVVVQIVYEHVQVSYMVQVVVEHVQVQRVCLVQIGLSQVFQVGFECALR